MKRFSVLGIAVAMLPLMRFAETVAQQKIASTERILPLVKITVGPDDQYHGTMDPQGMNLISHINPIWSRT